MTAELVVEGTCRHCGATMLYYPNDKRVAHRVPECDAYVREMAPRTKGEPAAVMVDGEGQVVPMSLFARRIEVR